MSSWDTEEGIDYEALARTMRNNIKEQLPDMKPIVKFNGGNPVVLCALCRRIVQYGVKPATARAQICEEFVGCGV